MDEKYLPVLEQCPLFREIAARDIPAMLGCLSARAKRYEKGETIFAAGAAITQMGIVLAGSVLVQQDDYWGNRTILAALEPGELFAEAFSCAGVPRLPVTVSAAEPAEALLIDTRRVVTGCAANCGFHARLIQNMMTILAQKNVALTQKMETVTQRTTRDKLLAYLSRQAQRAGGGAFDIPFNRQQLADYLSVDRSAMSGELSRMQREGLLHYHKNHFELVQ